MKILPPRECGGVKKEETLAPNYSSEVSCSNQPGATFTALGDKVLELCEIIKQRRQIHYNLGVMTRDIRLAYGKAQEERRVKALNEEINQAT